MSDKRRITAQGVYNKRGCDGANGALTCSDIVPRSCALAVALVYQRELRVRHDTPARILRCGNFFFLSSVQSGYRMPAPKARRILRRRRQHGEGGGGVYCEGLYVRARALRLWCTKRAKRQLARRLTPGRSRGEAFVAAPKLRPSIAFIQTTGRGGMKHDHAHLDC